MQNPELMNAFANARNKYANRVLQRHAPEIVEEVEEEFYFRINYHRYNIRFRNEVKEIVKVAQFVFIHLVRILDNVMLNLAISIASV